MNYDPSPQPPPEPAVERRTTARVTIRDAARECLRLKVRLLEEGLAAERAYSRVWLVCTCVSTGALVATAVALVIERCLP